ncbi:MAG: polyprenyl synthetase family protein [Nocardioidaceae bacterium]|nr:polyprenyl synthetase family protein [Nocardioidaceae bacterium]
MSARTDLGTRVQAQLDAFLSERRVLLDAIGPETSPLLTEVTAATGGGKRLRPAFCLAGWRAAGGDPGDDRIVRAAAAFELLQGSALVHDDLIDGSDTRRGRPAAHRALAAGHTTEGWQGDPHRFGAAAALLVGDLLLTWAHEMLRSCGLDPAVVSTATVQFDACTTEVICGQYLDLVAQVSASATEDLALRVIRYKSAAYTVVRPLHLGAALAGGGSELLDALSAYGVPVGTAFQLRDDVLSVFGDPDRTGKPAGDDLREGKRTVLLARTAERVDAAGLALLDRLVGDPDLDDEGLRRLRELIVASGALASVETSIAAAEQEALSALAALPAAADPPHPDAHPEAVRDELAALAAAALQRTR